MLKSARPKWAMSHNQNLHSFATSKGYPFVTYDGKIRVKTLSLGDGKSTNVVFIKFCKYASRDRDFIFVAFDSVTGNFWVTNNEGDLE